MPIEAIRDNVALENLPQAGYAAAMRLLVWYWTNDCAVSLPERSEDRRAVARAHQATWAENHEKIIAIFNQIKGEFDRAWEVRGIRAAGLQKLTDKALAARRARRLLVSVNDPHVSNHAPQRRADIRQAAAEARAVTAKEKGFAD